MTPSVPFAERWKIIMKKKIVTILLALCLSCSITACDDNSSEPVGKEQSKEPVYLEETEIADLFSNPEDYKGKYVKLSGKIFNKPNSDKGTVAYQVWHDTQNSDKDFLFFTDNASESYSVDDYIVVDGRITGTFEGENAFGGSVKCPTIEAVSVEKQSYIDAVVPTITEITPENAISEQHGISLKVDKVEFAEKETRIYLTETNSSTDKFSMWIYDIKLLQNGQQIEQDMASFSAYEGNYAELSSDILPNASSSGVLVFPPMDSSASFQIYAEGHSDNYELDFQPFIIDITAQ